MSDRNELNRKLVYHCRVFDVYEGDVRLPDGRIFKQSWIDHRPCIAVVPVNPEGNLVLIRQYRHATGGMIVEIPAGNMDREDEEVEACVQRELAEEVGFQAGRLSSCSRGIWFPDTATNTCIFSSPSISIRPRFRPTRTSISGCMTASFAEAGRMIREKEIIDAKTALGIQMAQAAAYLLSKNGDP